MFRNLLCVAGGVALGYYLAHVRLEKKYLDLVDREAEESKQYYREKYQRETAENAEMVVEAAEAMTTYMAADQTTEPKVVSEKKSLIKTPPRMNYNHVSTPPKVTEASEETETSEEEVLEIDIISKTDFFEDQFSYKQIMLTYWAGDDILSNEKEEPILGAARNVAVGEEALAKLKAGPTAMNGENVLFVRNRTGKWEFEITRDEQKYEEVVGPITITDEVPQIDATE